MSPAFTCFALGWVSFPRSRGDEPQAAEGYPGGAEFSPLTRG